MICVSVHLDVRLVRRPFMVYVFWFSRHLEQIKDDNLKHIIRRKWCLMNHGLCLNGC